MSQAQNYLPQVREQYELLPYPHRDPELEKMRLSVPLMDRMDAVNHHCFKGKQDFNDFRVLVAGGGTGDSTILWAEQLRDKKNAEVVYLDMSSASMKITKDRAKIRDLTNIKWLNESLLDLPDLDLGQFDYINCNGVLHHLEDPDAGLKALKSVLKPSGVMFLMVYATYGRTGIYQVQELMRMINDTDDSIHKKISNTRDALSCLPEQHWFNLTQKYGWQHDDINDDSALFDLLLHSQDRSYTIGEVHDWLENCGLEMTSDPGSPTVQQHYRPETYIKNETLLKQVKQQPLKKQQAISEALSTQITIHEFYAKHDDQTENTVADIQNPDLVFDCGILIQLPFEKLSGVAKEQQKEFSITFEQHTQKPTVVFPDGPYIPIILKHLKSNMPLSELKKAIETDAELSGPFSEDVFWDNVTKLMINLTQAQMGFLRDKNISPFTLLSVHENRVKDFYS